MAPTHARNRIRSSRIIALVAIALLVVGQPLWSVPEALHETIEYLGYALVILCVLGRIWCTIYIGGWKNDRLITVGPYSIMRNPLYVFSFIGLVGIGMMAESVTVAAFILVAFVLYYGHVVRREETFLAASFGPVYDRYSARVPRWIPRLRLYESPERIEIKPRYVLIAMRDSVWFFVAFPLTEAVEAIHEASWNPALFLLP